MHKKEKIVLIILSFISLLVGIITFVYNKELLILDNIILAVIVLLINLIYLVLKNKRLNRKLYKIVNDSAKPVHKVFVEDEKTKKYYQVFISNKQLYLIYVGSHHTGLLLQKEVNDFDNVNIDENDIVIELSKLRSINVYLRHNPFLYDYGMIKIENENSQKRKYIFSYKAEVCDVVRAMKDEIVTITTDKNYNTTVDTNPYQEYSTIQKEQVKCSSVVNSIISLYIVWMFLLLSLFTNHQGFSYYLVLILNLLNLFISLVLSIISPQTVELMFIDEDKKKVHSLNSFLLAFVIILYLMADYSIYKDSIGILLIGIISLIISILFGLFYVRLRMKLNHSNKRYTKTIIIYLFFILFAFNLLVNYYIESPKISTDTYAIVGVEDSTINSGYYRIYYNDDKTYIDVNQNVYDQVSQGNFITISTYRGLLHVKYHKVELN